MTDQIIGITISELTRIVRAAVREELAARGAAPAASDDIELAMPDVLKLLSIRQPGTIWWWRREQGFPAPRKFGNGRVRWRKSEVDAWRASRQVSGPGEVGAASAAR